MNRLLRECNSALCATGYGHFFLLKDMRSEFSAVRSEMIGSLGEFDALLSCIVRSCTHLLAILRIPMPSTLSRTHSLHPRRQEYLSTQLP